MKRYIFLLLILLFCIPRFAFADVRLAVLEFGGTGIDKSGLRILSDKVREGVLEVSKHKRVDGEVLIILTRENIQQIIKDQGKTLEDCEGTCEVEIAKEIGADYVISGDVSVFDGLYITTVKLHRTSNSNLLSTKMIESETKRNLLSNVKKITVQICKEGLSFSDSLQKKGKILQQEIEPKEERSIVPFT